MATLRFRNNKWQVQVRRLGHQSRTETFLGTRRWIAQYNE